MRKNNKTSFDFTSPIHGKSRQIFSGTLSGSEFNRAIGWNSLIKYDEMSKKTYNPGDDQMNNRKLN